MAVIVYDEECGEVVEVRAGCSILRLDGAFLHRIRQGDFEVENNDGRLRLFLVLQSGHRILSPGCPWCGNALTIRRGRSEASTSSPGETADE